MVFFCEIFGGLTVFSRFFLPGASLGEIVPDLRRASGAPPRDGWPDLVRPPLIFILVLFLYLSF